MISAEGGAAVTHDHMQSEGELPARGDDDAGGACEPGSGAVQIPFSTGDSPESNSPAPADGGESVARTRDSRTGSTLVEFAFVLLPLLAIIFGAIEMDRMLLVYTTLSNASRAGVRYATVHGTYRTQSGINGPSSQTSHSNVDSTVKAVASAGLLDTSQLGIVVTYNVNGSSACLSPAYNNPGCRVSVTASYPYDPFTSFFPLQVTLRSTSQGVITF